MFMQLCSSKVIPCLVSFPYLTFEVMGFGMEHGEEWLHLKQVLELRTAFRYFLKIWPVLACYIHAKKCDPSVGQPLLQVQGVCKYLTPIHVQGTK